MFFFRAPAHRKLLQGKKILIASTGRARTRPLPIRRVLFRCRCRPEVIDLGAEVDPDEDRPRGDRKLRRCRHDQHAQRDGPRVLQGVQGGNASPGPFRADFVGGVLNQKFERQENAGGRRTDEIARMGFHPCIRLQDIDQGPGGEFLKEVVNGCSSW